MNLPMRLYAQLATTRSLIFLVSLAASAGLASDWPCWRGNDRDGTSRESITMSFPAAGPKRVWHAAVGTGFSSVSVAGGRAYTMGNTNGEDSVWCLDAKTGREIWRHRYLARLDPQYYEGGPSATPTVFSNRVFTISKWGDVFCLEAATGKICWQRALGASGIRSNRWGFAGSPLIWRDLVILNAGLSGTALDRATGRIVWSSGTNTAGYATPVLWRSKGQDRVLMFGAKFLFCVEPQTGRELWRFAWETGYDTNNTDPLLFGDRILISSYSRGCALLTIESGNPQPVYDSKVLCNHLSPGIVMGEYLYAFHGQAHFSTDLRCIHLPTGKAAWVTKDPPFGSLISAGAMLIALSEKGELLLAEPSPTQWKVLSRAKVMEGLCWTPPTLAHGLLYVRNAGGDLVCLDLR
jgi:outer membrane protein assembly factor BamB